MTNNPHQYPHGSGCSERARLCSEAGAVLSGFAAREGVVGTKIGAALNIALAALAEEEAHWRADAAWISYPQH